MCKSLVMQSKGKTARNKFYSTQHSNISICLSRVGFYWLHPTSRQIFTGKTSVVKRYVHRFFSQQYRATVSFIFLPLFSLPISTIILYKAKSLSWHGTSVETGAFPWRVAGDNFCLRFFITWAFCPCGLPLFQLGDLPLYRHTILLKKETQWTRAICHIRKCR